MGCSNCPKQNLLTLVAIVLVGLLGVHSSGVIATRFSEIQTVRIIVKNSFCAEDIFKCQKNATTHFLHYISLFFYLCVLATELSVEQTPIITPLGLGTISAMSHDLPTIALGFPDYQQMFFVGVGLQGSCQFCNALVKENYVLIPVESILKNSFTESAGAVTEGPMDILALEVTCKTLVNASWIPKTTNSIVEIYPAQFEETSDGVRVELYLTSLINQLGAAVTRNCNVILSDRSAVASIKWGIDGTGSATRNSVSSVRPVDATTCEDFYDVCLNDSTRKRIGYFLGGAIFNQGNITMDQAYSLFAGFLADPSDLTIDDQTFSKKLAKTIASSLSSIQTMDSTQVVEIYTDTNGISVIIPYWLGITTVTAAGLVMLGAIVMIFTETVQLDGLDDSNLRRIHKYVLEGHETVSRMGELAVEQGKRDNHEWHLEAIKFGEDRRTRSDNVGIFG